jgi:hypothetical protein
MSAQENVFSQKSALSPSATHDLFNAAKGTRPTSTVHPIPLTLSYDHYVHEIPLSKTSDHYVQEIPVVLRDQVGATSVMSEKARPANPHRYLRPSN